MISYEDAKTLIEDKVSLMPTEEVPLPEALNRVVAKPVISTMNLPSFSNSAMDGYVFNAKDANSKTLQCVGSIAAGDTKPPDTLALGTCMEIMTGAPLPPNGDTVIPVENTQLEEGGAVHIITPVSAYKHVRLAGEDIEKGREIITSGTWLSARHISMLAGMGIGKVLVRQRPKVALLTTGNEVVADLSKPLEVGQIYNSSLYYLQAVVPHMGAEIVHTVVLKDDEALAKKTVLSILEDKENTPNIVITTGAVSAGKYDFIPSLIEGLGGEIYFHKVAQRPGKPILVGQFPQGVWLLGLPGNPVATMAGLRFIGGALFRGLLGLPTEKPFFAKLTSKACSKEGFTHFLKARTSVHKGAVLVDVLEGQASFMISPLLETNAWVEVPDDVSSLGKGEMVRVWPFVWPEIQETI